MKKAEERRSWMRPRPLSMCPAYVAAVSPSALATSRYLIVRQTLQTHKKSHPSFCDSELHVDGCCETFRIPRLHIMSSKAVVKTTFAAFRSIRPIYTGGSTSLDASGRFLLSCVGEDALLVDLETGDQLANLEGVSSPYF